MDSHCSFTSITLYFNCFKYFQQNLCFVAVERWPRNAVPIVRISCKPHAWKYMSGYIPPENIFVHLLCLSLGFTYNFCLECWILSMSLSHFYVDFLSFNSSEKASDWYEFLAIEICSAWGALQLQFIRHAELFWFALLIGNLQSNVIRTGLAWSRGQHACLHKQQWGDCKTHLKWITFCSFLIHLKVVECYICVLFHAMQIFPFAAFPTHSIYFVEIISKRKTVFWIILGF